MKHKPMKSITVRRTAEKFAPLFCAITLLFVAQPGAAAESEEFASAVVSAQAPYLTEEQGARLFDLLTTSRSLTRNIGTERPDEQFGPNNSSHPVSRATCRAQVLDTGLIKSNEAVEAGCGARWMAPIPDASGGGGSASGVCIDRFEFPNMPCEYPVVWVSSAQAKNICESQGKRLCDSHEWESSCAGSMKEDYGFTGSALMGRGALQAERRRYNQRRERTYAYQWNQELAGITDTRDVCGVYSASDPDINVPHSNFNSIGKARRCHSGGSDYRSCGTNTWPAGFKANCVTAEGVHDMHGNVAEVVNFPRSPAGLGRAGGSDRTERKGSFFVYRRQYPNDCRVRQPFEHFNNAATDRHSYYQEGFRCCKDVGR